MKDYNFEKYSLRTLFYFLIMGGFCLSCTSANEAKVGKVYLDSIPKSKQGLPTRIDTAYSAQDSINYALIPPIKSELWDTLRNIKYDKEGIYGHTPYFTEKHKALHGKKIKIQGYMHALEATRLQKWFMLSYYPSNACFFCGAAGVETAIEVKSPKGINFKQDKLITIQGTFYLNFDEPERLFYLIEGAELID